MLSFSELLFSILRSWKAFALYSITVGILCLTIYWAYNEYQDLISLYERLRYEEMLRVKGEPVAHSDSVSDEYVSEIKFRSFELRKAMIREQRYAEARKEGVKRN